MFRGFYVWNSEVGDKTFGVATMYLRGVCQNRNLWGVEGFNELTFKHTAGAPNRFLDQAAPALQTFSDGSTTKLIAGVKAAKAAKVSSTDEERINARVRASENPAELGQQDVVLVTLKATSLGAFAQGLHRGGGVDLQTRGRGGHQDDGGVGGDAAGVELLGRQGGAGGGQQGGEEEAHVGAIPWG
jgi:hypothetical protein